MLTFNGEASSFARSLSVAMSSESVTSVYPSPCRPSMTPESASAVCAEVLSLSVSSTMSPFATPLTTLFTTA